MVLRRRSEYGFVGHNALVVPRARRSIRKKASCKKTFDEGQLCAFDLLATVAGKLLQEVESCSASSSAAVELDHVGSHKNQFIKQELVEEPLRNGQDDHGSSEESVVSSGLRSPKSIKKEVNTVILKSSSTVDSSCSMKMGCSDVKSVTDKSDDGQNEFVQTPSKIDGVSPKCVESLGAVNVDNTIAVGEGDGGLDDEVSAAANKFRSKDSGVRLCGKSPPQINSNGDTNIIFEQLPLERGSPVSDASFVRHRNDIKIGKSRDDDEILSQSSDPSSVHLKACPSTTPVRKKGISKILTSKYWKSGPELKDYEITNSGSKLSNIYRNKKPFYSHERFQHHDTPFKKRKLVGQSSVLTQDAGVSSESASNVTDKGVIDDKSSPMLKPERDKGVSSPTIDRQRSLTSRSSRVKLSIKSFTVPELLIEVPESTSVGSLKKTIVEAVTTVFGGGLRVGLLLNGKRVHDDGRTLLQTGLSEEDNINNLGFLLEPSSPSTLPSSTMFPKASAILTTGDSSKDFVNSTLLAPREGKKHLDKSLEKTTLSGSAKVSGNTRQDLVPFAAHAELEKKTAVDSRAVPENAGALAVIPASQRPRRSEIGQRRTRRPFSVSEVEALVQAVEKLGTGRWRDVKLCAFENAKHRTYVDLKDKWKTLVHTAKISPQQRRGEPVPQELLDRVLAAHAYWSQHQAKQHGKQQLQHHSHHRAPVPIEKVAV